jgi:uncharacterized protein (TIGR02246 family)
MNAETEKPKIRQVIEDWLRASREGNTDAVLELMAEDVAFLQPGQDPMLGREAFAIASRAASGKIRLEEATPRIREIVVLGDYAYCWNHLDLKFTTLETGAVEQRSGDVLSIFRKETDGRWVLFRDANLLAPPPEPRQPDRAIK